MASEAVALLSDAGTPLISDPGYKLVRDARAAGRFVTTLPGPSAAIAALTLSGLPTDRFLFIGFLSAKAKARGDALGEIAAEAEQLGRPAGGAGGHVAGFFDQGLLFDQAAEILLVQPAPRQRLDGRLQLQQRKGRRHQFKHHG